MTPQTSPARAPARSVMRPLTGLLAAAALACSTGAAWAQAAWPARQPIRILLTSTPSAPSDIVMRVAADRLLSSRVA